MVKILIHKNKEGVNQYRIQLPKSLMEHLEVKKGDELFITHYNQRDDEITLKLIRN